MSERETLKARAIELGLDLPGNIPNDKLKAAVVDAEAALTSGSVVVVVGPSEGRWRLGRHFTSEPVEIPASELSKDDMLALKGDARLIVSTR